MIRWSWDKARDGYNYFLFWVFYPPDSRKNRRLKKVKKKSGDIIILHICTKNYDQMMYGSWDMVRDGRTDRRTDGRKDGRTNGKSDI